MKVTIDSTERLDDTLRVVGALYNVTLEVSSDRPARTRSSRRSGKPTSQAASRTGRGARTSEKRDKPQKGKPRVTGNGNGGVDTALVRTWARANGHEIADRGRVPAAVLTAYKQANRT